MGLPARRLAFEELRERLRSATGPPPGPVLKSGIPALDGMLGGGFPRGVLAALEGAAGRWSLIARLLARATRRNLAAIIDAGELYPPDLAAAGVALERLLVIPACSPLVVARAADALLRSRACAVIALSAPPLRAALWVRLAGLAHKHGALLIVVAGQCSQELAMAAGVRLRCEPASDGVRVQFRHESIGLACSR